jgi:hypothetical protein
MTSISTGWSLQQFLPRLALEAPESISLAARRPGGVFPHRAGLQGNGLLVVGGDAGREAHPKRSFDPVKE